MASLYYISRRALTSRLAFARCTGRRYCVRLHFLRHRFGFGANATLPDSGTNCCIVCYISDGCYINRYSQSLPMNQRVRAVMALYLFLSSARASKVVSGSDNANGMATAETLSLTKRLIR